MITYAIEINKDCKMKKSFEIGIHKLDRGYVYCKVLINIDPKMLVIPFENVLNSKK